MTANQMQRSPSVWKTLQQLLCGNMRPYKDLKPSRIHNNIKKLASAGLINPSASNQFHFAKLLLFFESTKKSHGSSCAFSINNCSRATGTYGWEQST